MMEKIKTIYIDMDGVIGDFVKRFEELSPLTIVELNKLPKEEKETTKMEAIKAGLFATMPLMPDAAELYEGLMKIEHEHGIELKILTAVGSNESDLVAEEKEEWVRRLFCREIEFCHVIKSHSKADYATTESILIDDRTKSTEPFVLAGGKAVLHTSAKTTLEAIATMI